STNTFLPFDISLDSPTTAAQVASLTLTLSVQLLRHPAAKDPSPVSLGGLSFSPPAVYLSEPSQSLYLSELSQSLDRPFLWEIQICQGIGFELEKLEHLQYLNSTKATFTVLLQHLWVLDCFPSSLQMKLSFSLPSKTNSKPNPIKPSNNFGDDSKNSSNPVDSKQFVTEFNAHEIVNDSGRQKASVIPPIQNEWEPRKRMKNFELPLVQADGSGGLHFEAESLSAVAEANDSNMSYGLNLRKSTKGVEETEGPKDQVIGSDSKPPLMEPSRNVPAEDGLLQKLKFDLHRLPEDQGMDEFTDMPVEGFGAALLAGYGWYEGRGIGKNAKEDVKVVEYHKRTDKRGLGFVSDDVPTPGVNSKQKLNSKGKENDREKEKEKGREDRDREGGKFVEKYVRIVGGSDAGLKGRIVEKLSRDRVVVRLSRSEKLVELQVGDVADLGSKEEERCLKRLKELKIKERGLKRVEEFPRSQDRSEIKANKPVREEVRRDSKSLNNESRNSSSVGQISWLTSHIRVRIISRDLKGGRLYLKKGKVVDVVSPRVCDISMDESNELIRGVSQDLLETALPRRGGPVLVLFGKHKGIYGSLVERDLDREIGIVRDADTHALHNVHLEQVAEYIGDPSYLGY
ncbi:hypothetical protein F8388_027073, partial [Cannabis sativa]